MKKLLAALLITCSTAFAAETVLLDVPARDLGPYNLLDSKMSVNMENGQVSGVLTASLERQVCHWTMTGYGGGYGIGYGRHYPGPYGRPYPGPVRRLVCFTQEDVTAERSEIIDNMMVVDNQIILKGEAGDVNCGVVKKGRIFKNTIKLVLNGKCTVTERSIRSEGERRVQLLLITK